MKKYLNKLLITAGLGMLIFSSCQKQETQIYYTGGTSPVLSANLMDSIPLVPNDSLNSAVTFSWTNPNYQFSNGISSQNVLYTLQIDKFGGNFNSNVMQSYQMGSSDTSITVKDLNTIIAGANKLGLPVGQTDTIQTRIISSFVQGKGQLVSNVLTFKVIPFTPPPPPPSVTPPTTGTLFIIGTAVGGWTNPISNPTPQQFTQVSATEYTLTISLIGGQEYKFIAKNGSWGENWGIATADDPTEITGGKFTSNSGNILAPATTALYDIDVNFQTGKFTVTPH